MTNTSTTNNMPEFTMPTAFCGSPIIAGVYLPRSPGILPMWLVVAEHGTRYAVARMTDEHHSAQTIYDIDSLDGALSRMVRVSVG